MTGQTFKNISFIFALLSGLFLLLYLWETTSDIFPFAWLMIYFSVLLTVIGLIWFVNLCYLIADISDKLSSK